jgi:hypothetical protein
VCSLPDVPLEEHLRDALPFVAENFVLILVLLALPALTLTLPARRTKSCGTWP